MKRPRRAALTKYETPSKRIRTLSPAQTLATSQLIKRELRRVGDVKYSDTSGSLTNITSTGAIYSLFANMARGDLGTQNFSGNTVSPIGITVNFGINTAEPYNFCRVMIFQWLDSGTPNVSGILASTVAGIAPFSPVLVTNRKEIRVLSDTILSVAPNAGSTAAPYGNGCFVKKIFINGSKLEKIRFNASSATVQHGCLYMLVISDDATAATYPQINYYTRVSFTD